MDTPQIVREKVLRAMLYEETTPMRAHLLCDLYEASLLTADEPDGRFHIDVSASTFADIEKLAKLIGGAPRLLAALSGLITDCHMMNVRLLGLHEAIEAVNEATDDPELRAMHVNE